VAEALVNTYVLSELLRGRNPTIVARVRDHVSRAGSFAISRVTVMDLAKGLEKAGRADTLDALLARLGRVRMLPFAEAEVRRACAIYGALERLGTPIGRADPSCDVDEPIVHVEAVNDGRSAARELIKYMLKDIAANGETIPPDVFSLVYQALAERRLRQASKGFMGLAKSAKPCCECGAVFPRRVRKVLRAIPSEGVPCEP
jgi:tRNA(fMet)-specific endonuclease VapC